MQFNFLIFFSLFYFSFRVNGQIAPSYSVTINTKQISGYYFLNPTSTSTSSNSVSYNMIIDQDGNLLYCKKFVGSSRSMDFKMQVNGLISYYSRGKYFLMDKTFKIVDSVYCKNKVQTDGHDLQILANGHFLLLGNEEAIINLSGHKFFKPNNCAGSPKATVTCGVIQELDTTKNVVFEWHSKSYFKFMEMDTFFIGDPKKVDWTHFNALEQDQDGNILVSVRNFNEITKINRKDSSIIWRLGGNKNQFHFKNDSLLFKNQHDIRRLPNGNITLFDNGRNGPPFHYAAAKEYGINENTHTAHILWQYVNDTNAHSSSGLGNVQRLLNGNTLVNYGSSNKTGAIFSVVSPQKDKCFELFFKDTLRCYRVLNYTDLNFNFKRPEIRSFEKEGKLYLDGGKGHSANYWSTGETTPTILVKDPGKYTLAIPTGDGGLIISATYTIMEIDLKRKKGKK